MTPEAQRIAIAEACPTVFVRPPGAAGWNYRHYFTGRVLPCIDGDPLKDLNAMHQAEQVLLTNLHWQQYLMNLWNVVHPFQPNPKPVNIQNYLSRDFVRAAAHQRAEAFLRTLGKWVD